MDEIPVLPYYSSNDQAEEQGASEVFSNIDYSVLYPSKPVEGLVVNKGIKTIAKNFDEFFSHTDMCYEFSGYQILEPDSNEDGLSDVLICFSEENDDDTD